MVMMKQISQKNRAKTAPEMLTKKKSSSINSDDHDDTEFEHLTRRKLISFVQ